MHIYIWIGKSFLEQFNKNINLDTTVEGDLFDRIVEYTDVAVMQGQIMVSIKYDKYIELIENGLLVEWSAINPE